MVDVKRSLVKLTLGSTFLLTALACPAQVMTAGALLLGEDSLKLLMTAISGVSAGNVANAIDALTQGKDPDVVSLQNEDVTRAVGRAIAAVISQAAEQYPGETKNQLNKIAAQAKDHWVSLWLSFVKQERYSELNETQLPEVLIPTETHLTQETILGIEEWKDIFIRLNMAACPGGGFSLPPEVYQQVAKLLYTTFPKSLRESLKDDFAKDGKAFAGLAIQLLAGTRAALGKLQEDQKHEFSSVLEHFQKLESLLKPLQDIPTIKDNTEKILQGQQEQTDNLSEILGWTKSQTSETLDLKLYKALLKLLSFTDADLSNLSSIIQDKTVYEMVKKAYQESLPLDANLSGEGQTNLNQMLSQLDEFKKLGDFWLRLSQDENLPLEYQSYLKDFAEKLKSEVNTQYYREKYIKSYLMIKIEVNEANRSNPKEYPTEFLVNGWLLMNESSGEPDVSQFKPILYGHETAQGISCQKDHLHEVFNKFVDNALNKYLIAEYYQLNIEVFLPMSLMGINVDQWKIDDPILDQRPLGVRYPIRLRSLERMNLPYLVNYRCNWQQNWDRVRTFLGQTPDPILFEHLQKMENLKSKRLAIQLAEKICLKVTCPIPQDKTEELFKGILLATTPIALWTRCEIEPDSNASAEIDEVLSQLLSQPLNHLCKSVQQIREKADAEEDEQHLGCHLSLLWDNPYRLLPDAITELKKYQQHDKGEA
jgi:hypothetical protein